MENISKLERKNTQFESFKNLADKGKKYFLGLASIGVISGLEAQEESIPNNLEKEIKIESSVDPSYNVNFDQTLYIKDENGKPYFNPWGIVAPIQLEGTKEIDVEDKIDMSIPYKYSRQFDHAEAQSESERQALIEMIKLSLKQEFANELHYLFKWNKDSYDPNQPDIDFSKLNIKKLTIKGLASPEAEDRNSITNKNPENTSLAKLRAENMSDEIVQALKELGIDPEIVETTGEETSFSNEELEKLEKIAENNYFYVGGLAKDDKNFHDIEAIFALTRMYNFDVENPIGKRLSEEDREELDKIIGSKRGVEIELDVEGKEKDIVIIPVPLLLLLPWRKIFRGLGGGLRKINKDNFYKLVDKIEGSSNNAPADNQTETYDRQIFSETTEHQKNLDDQSQNFHDVVREVTKKTEYSPKIKEGVNELVLTDEIARYIDDPRSAELGLDYRQIIRDTEKLLQKRMPRYDWNNEVQEKVAEMLLDSWQMYDRNVRRGIKTVDGQLLPIATNLEYRHDEDKVLWAMEGAKHILEILRTAFEVDNISRGEDDAPITPNTVSEEAVNDSLRVRVGQISRKIQSRGNTIQRH